MKIEIVILFAIVAIASSARERVLYEAFSGLDCQAADLGSIVVRFEDDDQPRYDCTNYNTTYVSRSYRSTAGAPIPEAESDWAYVSVQNSECPVTDAMEYTLYAGRSSNISTERCWTYHNFTVFVDGTRHILGINFLSPTCDLVFELADYNETEVCFNATTNFVSSALGAIPIEFTPVAQPSMQPTAQRTPGSSPGTSQTNNAIATSALMTSFGALVVLPLVL